MAGLRIAHVQMKDRGAGVVAIHRLLSLLLPGHGNVLGIIARQPLRAIWRHRDDEFFLIFRKHGILREVHFVVSSLRKVRVRSTALKCLSDFVPVDPSWWRRRDWVAFHRRFASEPA